ncbi:hypothetical protein [uncultured Mucilaginibacter sp.]|uniref:hypothetical protein n=1 Tax=uncultured Mucilaginibacter sp. TaxID=797541 RepID=UPI0025E9129B|nr:hypothetical protein [uncultured Mucilaginibacter sp.]
MEIPTEDNIVYTDFKNIGYMKIQILLILFFAGLLACFAACKKVDALEKVADSVIPDTTTYTLKKGTVTIKTPDTTYVFTAPGDEIHFSGDSSYYNINCYRDQYTSFSITSSTGPKLHGTSNIYEIHLYGLYQNVSQIYSNTYNSGPIGTMGLTDYLTNSSIATGTFNANIAKVANGSQANQQYYNISGSFDLKLNQ